MAGCEKAGRKRNSNSNKRYIAGNRRKVNKDKRVAAQLCEPKKMKVPRGTARRKRRHASA